MWAIEVRDLVVAYRQGWRPPLRAVDRLLFVVNEGEIVGFLGSTARAKARLSRC